MKYRMGLLNRCADHWWMSKRAGRISRIVFMIEQLRWRLGYHCNSYSNAEHSKRIQARCEKWLGRLNKAFHDELEVMSKVTVKKREAVSR